MAASVMNVLSIGMLAHNEAALIGRTIASLACQSILDPGRWPALGLDGVSVVVVPNGCSDTTAETAEAALALLPDSIAVSVQVLEEPGKANAWNRFVHELAPAGATLLALMDADIEFGADDVMERLVERLRDDPSCDAATDRAVKDYRNKRLTPFNRASRRVSDPQGGTGNGGLCGQLYCGRADVLRRIWLPAGLPVEDGFIAAMLGSEGFTLPQGRAAIAYVPEAWHYYEPLTDPAAFVRHEARIIVGSVINAWLFALMWEAGKVGHAGDYVRRRNEADPDWVQTLCENARRTRGGWMVPGAFIWWRLAPLRWQSPGRLLRRVPVAVAATLASLPAVLRANAILRRVGANRHW